MALNTQIVCNSCGTLLKGKHGMRFENKPHIFIKGRITLENRGDELNRWHMFVTKTDDEETTVCNLVCLEEYLNMREAQYKKYREQNLRKEASMTPGFSLH